MICKLHHKFNIDATIINKFKNLYQFNDNNCWIWIGSKDKDGYGRIQHNRKAFKAHRLSFILHYLIDPQDKMVCHTCDNPSCVNPEHLWLGDAKANTLDMISKKRHLNAARERSLRQKGKALPEETKQKISNTLKGRVLSPMTEQKKEKLRQANLGKTIPEDVKMKIALSSRKDTTIKQEYKTKDNLQSLAAQERAKRCDFARAKLTKEDVLRIRTMSENMSYKAIAKVYNVDPSSISNIVKRITWKHLE